jgi:DNA-binding MarR family transcriptional regulator
MDQTLKPPNDYINEMTFYLSGKLLKSLKAVRDKYDLNTNEISILKHIYLFNCIAGDKSTISYLRKATGQNYFTLRLVIRHLERKGITNTIKKKSSIIYVLSDYGNEIMTEYISTINEQLNTYLEKQNELKTRYNQF